MTTMQIVIFVLIGFSGGYLTAWLNPRMQPWAGNRVAKRKAGEEQRLDAGYAELARWRDEDQRSAETTHRNRTRQS